MQADDQAGPSANDMRAFAYLLLGRREYSVFELVRRLRKKWPQTEGIEALAQQLERENLVSDERFAESFLRSRLGRSQGPVKIKAELRGRGVSDAIVSSTLEAASPGWLDLAIDWLQRQHPDNLSFEEKPKYYRRLRNRGFTHGQAMDAINHSR